MNKMKQLLGKFRRTFEPFIRRFTASTGSPSVSAVPDPKPLASLTAAEAPLFSLPTGDPLQAKVLDVYDGDTITVALEVFPGIYRSFRLRLQGIDTPELRPPLSTVGREEVVAFAEAARDYLASLIMGKVVCVNFAGTDKFGRQLGTVYLQENGVLGSCVNDLILQHQFGKEYHGGKR